MFVYIHIMSHQFYQKWIILGGFSCLFTSISCLTNSIRNGLYWVDSHVRLHPYHVSLILSEMDYIEWILMFVYIHIMSH